MRLHDRRVVEQAKGVLMLRYGGGSYEALGLMARWSAEAGVAVDDTARALVSGICQGRMSGTGEHAALMRLLEQRLRESEPDPLPAPVARKVQQPRPAITQDTQTTPHTPVTTEKEIFMEQTPSRVPEQRKPVDDSDLRDMSVTDQPAQPGQHEAHQHRHHSLRGLAGGLSDRRWRYDNALEAARRLSSGGGRPAASSG